MISKQLISRVIVLALVGIVSLTFMNAHAQTQVELRATADVVSCDLVSEISGNAVLEERLSDQGIKEVDVTMFVRGLPDGNHAVHIHEAGSCEPCDAAGGHFDPGPNGNPDPDSNHPFHMGDLVNMEVGNGVGILHTTTSRVTLSGGSLSIFDGDGSAFIVHVNPDTFCPNGPEEGCAGGAPSACGVIQQVGVGTVSLETNVPEGTDLDESDVQSTVPTDEPN